VATIVDLPRMDHFFMDHESMLASFQDKGPKAFDAKSVDVVIDWLMRR
jgi:hypothetical protein